MQISESQVDKRSLEQFAQEAASLLQDGNFLALAERFGYAMAYGREPASAIETDLSNRLQERGSPGQLPFVDIKYFNEKAAESTGLVAAIDCAVYLAGDFAVQFSLVVTRKDFLRYISLESVGRI
jgi:hypothetical protein